MECRPSGGVETGSSVEIDVSPAKSPFGPGDMSSDILPSSFSWAPNSL